MAVSNSRKERQSYYSARTGKVPSGVVRASFVAPAGHSHDRRAVQRVARSDRGDGD